MSAFYAKVRPTGIFRQCLSLWLFLLTSAACGHDFWIEPAQFRASPGQQISLVLRVGEDLSGDSMPYITNWFSDYRIVTPSGDRPVQALMGDDPAGTFTAEEPGVYLVGYRSTRDFVEMAPEKFDEYLRAEGLEWVIERRAARGEAGQPARELYSRCAKSLVVIGDGQPADAWRRNLGYTLELMPGRNPATLSPGDELPLKVYYQGEPIADLLVIAFTGDRPADRLALRTDSAGQVVLPLDRAGLWLIKAVHIIELEPGHPRAQWESFWGSLTFELAAATGDTGG